MARLTRTLRAKLRRVRSNLGLAADLPLLHFASIGDVERVRLALASGRYSLQELDEGLRAAAAGGDLNVIIALHQGGLSLDRSGGPALTAAAENGHVEVVRYLHQKGVDVRHADDEALRTASARGRSRVIEYLHRSGSQHALLSVEARRRIAEMESEIKEADAVYHPSRFWTMLNNSNVTLLNWGGEENFKRTINQNYFNFVPTSLWDPRMRRLMSLWLRHPSLAIVGYRIQDPDHDPALWFSWDESYEIFKRNRPLQLQIYKLFVALLYEYGVATDDSRVLARLEEPPPGNPIRITRFGRLVSQDLVNSVRERNVIVAAFGDLDGTARPIVAELGAGYGRLGYALLATTRCRYIVFDIAPALYIAEWYLSRLFPRMRIFRFRHFRSYLEIADELAGADIAFFTANQLELLPDRWCDALVTVSSLHEMRVEQISHFLALMATKARRLIYLKQHERYVNPYDGLTIDRGHYTFPSEWRIVLERSDVVNPGFFELVAARQE